MKRRPRSSSPSSPGIPARERWWIGARLRWTARARCKDDITARFRAEVARALALASALPVEQAQQPVHLPRSFGIEDSHRDWSVYMALEHLVLVNTTVTAMLPRLYAGRAPASALRVEDAKPSPTAGPEQIERLALLVERYTDTVDKLGNLHLGSVYPHPWFGPLSAAQWHALAAIHNRLHRRQIERIVAALRRASRIRPLPK